MAVSPSTRTFSSSDFIQLALSNDVLKFGEYVLKSGRISPYFFNAGLLATGETLSVLANGYAQLQHRGNALNVFNILLPIQAVAFFRA